MDLSGWTSPTSEFSKQQRDNDDKIPDRMHSKEKRRLARGDCTISASTSHTQYFRRDMHARNEFKRITTDEFCGLSADSLSGSSDTFGYVHGEEGKQYTQKELLKRNLIKNLDPLPTNPELKKKCPPTYGWEIAKKIEFLLKDPVAVQQVDRIQEYLRDFAKISSGGFRIDTLDSLCVILDYLVDSIEKKIPYYREGFIGLMKNVEKPIVLIVSSNVMGNFEVIKNFLGYLGYLLLPLEDDDLFELVSKGLLYHLSASDKRRGPEGARLQHTLAAAKSVLIDTVVRMIAIAKPSRFSTFIQIAFILACDSVDNCVSLMMENIIENIFYRFNPYFPERDLPLYDINPSNLDDYCLKLGDSSINMQTVLSLLLVLVQTMKPLIDENPSYRKILPYPDEYSQRCFVWVFRYECRAREHRHQRSTLTVIAHMLIHMFRQHLTVFYNVLMPDVLSLSVLTEIPPRNDWTNTVNFNISQEDVQFKKQLINLSVDFLQIYPINKFMAESRSWIVGLMYLVDPGLSSLKAKWTAVLFAELRKTALQALIISMKLIPSDIPTQISLIRRIMWYIEWYSELPYEMPILYWCVRLLHTSLNERSSPNRKSAIYELYHTHGVIILLHLCDTLMDQRLPPIEKSQAVIGLNLRLLTSCLQYKAKVSCYVYPSLKWPISINKLVRKMMNIVFYALEKRSVCSDRWLLSLLNFIWEGIVWKPEYRETFIANNGIYQLLDIITMCRYPVQCLALALICDMMYEGQAVGQLITWRANIYADPNLVKPGSAIAALLAGICFRDCIVQGVPINDSNVIQDLEFPLMSADCKKYLFSSKFTETRNQRTPFCLTASEIAGSCMAKCFAILQMLSKDLKEKVDIADETYNLYKNVELKKEDETMLVLLSHYLTIKFNEVWLETEIQSYGYIPVDTEIMNEFLHVGRSWATSIQQQQLNVALKYKQKELQKESNLYCFLERVRLNIALDALREVRCIARSSDRARIAHALIFDAVRAYHRRSVIANKLKAPVVQTYEAPLDDYNTISQNVRMINIVPKHKPKKREYLRSEPSQVAAKIGSIKEAQNEKLDLKEPRRSQESQVSAAKGSVSSKTSQASKESKGSEASQTSKRSQGSNGSQASKESLGSKGLLVSKSHYSSQGPI